MIYINQKPRIWSLTIIRLLELGYLSNNIIHLKDKNETKNTDLTTIEVQNDFFIPSFYLTSSCIIQPSSVWMNCVDVS